MIPKQTLIDTIEAFDQKQKQMDKDFEKETKETWIAVQGDEHGFKEWYAERCKLNVNSNDR